jgi:hypothetical protein
MTQPTITRYWRNPPVGECLTRERLVLGLRNVLLLKGRQPHTPLETWLDLFCHEFTLAQMERDYLLHIISQSGETS